MQQSDIVSIAGGIAGQIVDALVKSNEPVIEEIDKDPKLKAQYEEDMAKLNEMQTNVQELMGLLFDKLDYGTREIDEYRIIETSRAIPYGMLRRAGETEVPRMIKNLRRLQLTDYAETASAKKFGKEQGFTLAWKNPAYEPTDAEEKKRKDFEMRIQQSFFFPAGEQHPSLAKFMGTAYEDFFDLDDITIAIVRDALFQPIGMHLQDPGLWFPTVPKVVQYSRFDADMLEDVNEPGGTQLEMPDCDYLLIQKGQRRMGVTRDMLIKSNFFTRSDYTRWRRGYSIMEQAANVTSIILNAMNFNAANFSNNRTPSGLLALSGGFTNQMQLEKFKKVLWASINGSTQGRRFPLIGLPKEGKAEWVNIHGTAKEMEFYTGMTLFTGVVYALSGTDPNESSLPSFHDAIKKSTLNEESKDGVWQKSKDNGLKTFLNHFENTINTLMTDGRNVFEQATGLPLKAQIVGLAAENMKEKMLVNKDRIGIDASRNELRKEGGMEPAEFMVETSNGPVNLYDIVGLKDVDGFIRQNIQGAQQQEMQDEVLKQQEETQRKQASGEDQYSDRDRELIGKYGEPA